VRSSSSSSKPSAAELAAQRRQREADEKAKAEREQKEAEEREKRAAEERRQKEAQLQEKLRREREAEAAAQKRKEEAQRLEQERLRKQQEETLAQDQYLERMRREIRLGARNCYGETTVGGKRPGGKAAVSCIDVSFTAYCPGSAVGIKGTLKNFIDFDMGCFGDTTKIDKPTCKANELKIVVDDVRRCQ
jgi:hypothetical protein